MYEQKYLHQIESCQEMFHLVKRLKQILEINQ
jgi:hypothetical protein